MSIFMDEARGLVTLQTKHSSYQMKRDPDGLLLHTYYGSRIHSGDDMTAQSGLDGPRMYCLWNTAASASGTIGPPP